MDLAKLKTAHLEVLQKMQQVVDSDLEKRQHYELLSSFKTAEERNRKFTAEIIQLRRAG